MSQEDTKRQMGDPPAADAGRDGQSQSAADHRQVGATASGHVEAGHGAQRTYSPRGIAADGSYVGQAGGYVGSHAGAAHADAPTHGEGTYGYPYGQGIGLVGERHPDDEAATLAGVGRDSTDFGPGDRFGAGRNADWRTAAFDPGFRDAEYMEFRNAHGRHLDRDYRDFMSERAAGSGFTEKFEAWRARRRQAGAEGEQAARPPGEEDSGF